MVNNTCTVYTMHFSCKPHYRQVLLASKYYSGPAIISSYPHSNFTPLLKLCVKISITFYSGVVLLQPHYSSECRAWLDHCRTSWRCGSEYDFQVFNSLPAPPCANPGPFFVPPSQPGVCQYNLTLGRCDFFDGMIILNSGFVHTPTYYIESI